MKSIAKFCALHVASSLYVNYIYGDYKNIETRNERTRESDSTLSTNTFYYKA